MAKIILSAVLALGLVGCTLPTVEAPAPVVTPVAAAPSCGLLANTLADEKALYAAETAYNVPAHAYVTLDTNRQLSAVLKARVKPYLLGAYEALVAARTAQSLGRTCDLYLAIDRVKSLANSAKAILPN